MPLEELEPIQLDQKLKHLVYVGSKLDRKIKNLLIQFLRRNIEVFAWKQEDMKMIDPSVITHKLSVNPAC